MAGGNSVTKLILLVQSAESELWERIRALAADEVIPIPFPYTALRLAIRRCVQPQGDSSPTVESHNEENPGTEKMTATESLRPALMISMLCYNLSSS